MNESPIVASDAVEWVQHPRFATIAMRPLLTSAQNPHASANIVRIPVGDEVGRHLHPTQIETVYMLAGQGVLTLGRPTTSFAPAGLWPFRPVWSTGCATWATSPLSC